MKVVAGSHTPRYCVLLDGVDVAIDCVEADDEQGYVMLVVTDSQGSLVCDEQGNAILKRREGKVEIIAMKAGVSHRPSGGR